MDFADDWSGDNCCGGISSACTDAIAFNHKHKRCWRVRMVRSAGRNGAGHRFLLYPAKATQGQCGAGRLEARGVESADGQRR